MAEYCKSCKRERMFVTIIRAPHNKVWKFIGCGTCGMPKDEHLVSVTTTPGRRSYAQFKREYDLKYGPQQNKDDDIQLKMSILREGKPASRNQQGMYDSVEKG